MTAREITAGVYAIGTIDWGREIFDELIPLPDGTTYNSYYIQGSEKTAIIDTVDPDKEEEYITNLVKLGIGTVDYIVVNHAEQDHSGSLPMILHLYPMATILTTAKSRDLLMHLLLIPEDRIRTVEDGETISLGGKTLEFLHAPWVHWPDTMLTFLREDRILFSCDLFGMHYATSSLYVEDERPVYEGAKRYYAEIMMPFRKSIGQYIERLDGMDIALIAPSHGPMHRRPAFILDAYREWISDEVKNLVAIPYISMHGSTAMMVQYLTRALIERGIEVIPFNISQADTGKVAMALVDAATIVIATPTVLFGPHPKMVYAAFLVNMLKPKTRCAAIIGSFGWGGKTVKVIGELLSGMNADILDPVYIKGQPTEEDFRRLNHLADEILKRHKDYNIV
jgi:flavorubredoxin